MSEIFMEAFESLGLYYLQKECEWGCKEHAYHFKTCVDSIKTNKIQVLTWVYVEGYVILSRTSDILTFLYFILLFREAKLKMQVLTWGDVEGYVIDHHA